MLPFMGRSYSCNELGQVLSLCCSAVTVGYEAAWWCMVEKALSRVYVLVSVVVPSQWAMKQPDGAEGFEQSVRLQSLL